MKKMPRVALSFDDGRADNAHIAFDILAKMDIPATFNITTGYIDGTCPATMSPSEKEALTIEEVFKIAKYDLFEIAMHGDKHLNALNDINAGKIKLQKWLNVSPETIFGFASPGTGFSVTEFNSDIYKDFRDSIAYMRLSQRIKTHAMVRILCRKVSRILHLPFLFLIAYKDTIMYEKEGKVLYAIPILKSIHLSEIKSIIQYLIKTDGSVVLMFHSIKDNLKNEDNFTWSENKFNQLCQYLCQIRDQNKIELCTSMELLRGLKDV